MANALELPPDDDGIGLEELSGRVRIRMRSRGSEVELPEEVDGIDPCCKLRCQDRGT